MGVYNKRWAETIHDGSANEAIKAWHANQPQRVQTCASPSTLTDCPRVVWLRYKKNVAPPIPLGWGKAQRLLLGRQLESLIASQYKDAGKLLYHWKDDIEGESVKFEMGEGDDKITGTPDLLLKLDKVVISDSKTSMAKSFGYIPTTAEEAFKDPFWYKYKLQVEAYYLLCHKNKDWFESAGTHDPKTGITLDVNLPPIPLPEACHLFSYALDDGVVRREFQWQPTPETAREIVTYARRWNRALRSVTMPACTCDEAGVKFCYMVTKQETTKTGAKIGTDCCNDYLGENL